MKRGRFAGPMGCLPPLVLLAALLLASSFVRGSPVPLDIKTVRIELPYIGHPFDAKTTPQRRRLAGDDSTWKHLRITPYYDQLWEDVKMIGDGREQEYYEHFVKHSEAAMRFLERTLKVVPVAGNWKAQTCAKYENGQCAMLAPSKCGGMSLPANHLGPCGEGVPETDLLLYFTARRDSACGDESSTTLAHAVPCFQDQWGRPVGGAVNFCKLQTNTEYLALVNTIVHEMTHVTHFSPGLFSDYRDIHTGNHYAQVVQKLILVKDSEREGLDGIDGEPAKWIDYESHKRNTLCSSKLSQPACPDPTCRWSENTCEFNAKEFVITPQVKETVQLHFGCDTIPGAELEDNGGAGTAGSHWEKQIFFSSVMQGSTSTVTYYTPFTLALAEDSGWYIGNWDQVGEYRWGKHVTSKVTGKPAGCEFLQGVCSPEHFPDMHCKGTKDPTTTTKGCTYELASPAYCNGGSDQLTNACPYMTGFSNVPPCHDAEGNKEKVTDVADTGQKFGLSATCSKTTLVTDHFKARSAPEGGCFTTECIGVAGAWTAVRIEVGPRTVTCSTGDEGKEMTVKGYNGKLYCPDVQTICYGEIPGYCDYGEYRSGKCYCSPGYRGQRCSERDLDPVEKCYDGTTPKPEFPDEEACKRKDFSWLLLPIRPVVPVQQDTSPECILVSGRVGSNELINGRFTKAAVLQPPKGGVSYRSWVSQLPQASRSGSKQVYILYSTGRWIIGPNEQSLYAKCNVHKCVAGSFSMDPIDCGNNWNVYEGGTFELDNKIKLCDCSDPSNCSSPTTDINSAHLPPCGCIDDQDPTGAEVLCERRSSCTAARNGLCPSSTLMCSRSTSATLAEHGRPKDHGQPKPASTPSPFALTPETKRPVAATPAPTSKKEHVANKAQVEKAINVVSDLLTNDSSANTCEASATNTGEDCAARLDPTKAEALQEGECQQGDQSECKFLRKKTDLLDQLKDIKDSTDYSQLKKILNDHELAHNGNYDALKYKLKQLLGEFDPPTPGPDTEPNEFWHAPFFWVGAVGGGVFVLSCIFLLIWCCCKDPKPSYKSGRHAPLILDSRQRHVPAAWHPGSYIPPSPIRDHMVAGFEADYEAARACQGRSSERISPFRQSFLASGILDERPPRSPWADAKS